MRWGPATGISPSASTTSTPRWRGWRSRGSSRSDRRTRSARAARACALCAILMTIESRLLSELEDRSSDHDLTELVGTQLNTVAFVMDYVEFKFNGPVLRALTDPMVDTDTG